MEEINKLLKNLKTQSGFLIHSTNGDIEILKNIFIVLKNLEKNFQNDVNFLNYYRNLLQKIKIMIDELSNNFEFSNKINDEILRINLILKGNLIDFQLGDKSSIINKTPHSEEDKTFVGKIKIQIRKWIRVFN